jgi:hypothetical protein
MRKTPIDAAGVTRRALYGMDDGWYDTYWCGEHPPAKPNRLIIVTRRLGIAIGTAVTRHFRWPARRHAADLLALVKVDRSRSSDNATRHLLTDRCR